MPSIKSSPPQENMDKKRESRMSGIFNLIKSRSSKSSSAATSPLTSSTSPIPSVTPVVEETLARSPTPPGKSPAAAAEPQPELRKNRTQSPNHRDGGKESGPTADVIEEKKEPPHTHRHVGVPVMGKDLLAEMKARQEKRQEKHSEKKVGGASGSLLSRLQYLVQSEFFPSP